MKKFTPFFITLLLILFTNSAFSQGIVINEILTSNTTINKDEDGSYQDWVELFNTGSTTINLEGYGLTDDATLPYKWTFPSVSIPAGQYLLVWCSDKNRVTPGSELHTNFKLSSAGDVVILTNPSNLTVDSVPATTLLQNVSYGRTPNGTGTFKFFNVVTPGAANGAVAYTEALIPPTFSKDSGFLTAGFDLTLSTTVPGATILYTLDGSEPKQSNLGGTTYSYKNQYPENVGDATGPLLSKSYKTLQYTAPISIVDRSSQPNKIAAISTTFSFNPTYIPANPIYKGTVVRAKLIKPGALESKTVSKTYFVSPLGVNRFSLPVVSLSINEDELFDYNKGIYVAGIDGDTWRTNNPTTDPRWLEGIGNYYRSGIENEKVANMTYLVNGSEVLNQEVGIKMRGGISRTFQSKSLTISARSDYGKNSLDYKFFSDLTYNSFTGLILRNAGGDFLNTMFRDALNQQICKSLYPDKESYQPTVTFINGEFWGILNIRDRYDKDYFKRVYNADAVDYVENDGSPKEGDSDNYFAMVDYVTNNSLAVPANYEYIKTQLDPLSFSDYFISNIFLQNEDWPNNNIQYWRNKNTAYTPNAPYGLDGRWRWLYHDMDNTFGFVFGDINSNTLATATSVDTFPVDSPINPDWSTLLLRKLLENPNFKNDFINRFADLLNTTFLSSRMKATVDTMKGVIYPTIPEHISRWKSPETKSDYDWSINYEKEFLDKRPPFQRNHIRSVFGISNNINAVLNVNDVAGGYIKMNTIDVKTGTDGITSNPYPWTGIYFSNIPVTLKAIANTGFVFSHWTGASTSTNPEITISSATDYNVTAVFVPETVASSHPIYYWMMNSTIANNLPLETLNSTYKAGTTDGSIQYQSCLVGYPFVSTDVVNWRKASMERRNSPTMINYIPEANNNLPFTTSDMKGLQIKEPLQNGGLDNTLIFNFSTSGYKDIKFSFAAINELTNATAITLDYSANSGTPIWQSISSSPITNAYQLFNFDLSSIVNANNNANFKLRLRFTGTNMTADSGARITINNIAVHGTKLTLAIVENELTRFSVFPNPFSDIVNVAGIDDTESVSYKLYTIDGKLIKNGRVESSQINLEELSKGMYMIQLISKGKLETKKIIKR